MHLLDSDQAGNGSPFTGVKQASSVPAFLTEGRAAAPSMDHLDALEAQSIYIFREAFARLKKLALLWSLGKDSNVMIWLARKAFFGRVPFPVLHVDTGKKFPEMYRFRDHYSKEWQLDYEPEQPRMVEPLMGWTSSGDMKQQLTLRFATKDEAVAYCERKGIAYQVIEPQERARRQAAYAEEYRCLCANGEYLWIRDHGRFVEFDGEGRATRMIGAHHNIHERKLIELELKRRNEELHELNRNLEQLVEQRTEALRQANLALAEQAAVAVRLSETDPLTQIYNRRRFESSLQQEWQRLQRHDQPVSLLMFDLDHFKRINDLVGHPVGDRVLVAVTQAVRRTLREEDCFARWGGEEFIVLLPNTPLASASRLAERLRLHIREACAELEQPLTASFALAGMRRAEPLENLLRRLDDALYRAKRLRDAIEVC